MEEERGPGLEFLVCVLCAAVVREGLPLFICVCFLLLKCLKCSPVPASFFPYLSSSLQINFDYHIKMS